MAIVVFILGANAGWNLVAVIALKSFGKLALTLRIPFASSATGIVRLMPPPVQVILPPQTWGKRSSSFSSALSGGLVKEILAGAIKSCLHYTHVCRLGMHGCEPNACVSDIHFQAI